MSDTGSARWGVVCTADEPLALLSAFSLHHIELGACEVHLFLDRHRRGARELLEQIPGVIVHAAHAGPRKPTIEKRQLRNANVAARQTRADWLAHIDSDEFIAPPPGQTMAELLAAQPDPVDFVLLPVRERIYQGAEGRAPSQSIFAGGALETHDLAANTALEAPALAARAPYVRRGLLGHFIGKSIFRTRRQMVPGIHRPRPTGAHPGADLKREALCEGAPGGAALYHFEGLTPFHWTAKLARAAHPETGVTLHQQPRGRRALIRLARRAYPNIPALIEIEKAVRQIDQSSIAALRDANAWHDECIDPGQAVVAAGLMPADAFTGAAFDAAFAEMYPELPHPEEIAEALRDAA